MGDAQGAAAGGEHRLPGGVAGGGGGLEGGGVGEDGGGGGEGGEEGLRGEGEGGGWWGCGLVGFWVSGMVHYGCEDEECEEGGEDVEGGPDGEFAV